MTLAYFEHVAIELEPYTKEGNLCSNRPQQTATIGHKGLSLHHSNHVKQGSSSLRQTGKNRHVGNKCTQ